MENIRLLIPFVTILLVLHNNLRMGEPAAHNAQKTQGYSLAEAFPKLTFDMPVELTCPDDGTDRIFVVEQRGVILVFQNSTGVEKAAVFLDIEKQVHSGGEAGCWDWHFTPTIKPTGIFMLTILPAKRRLKHSYRASR